MSHFSFIMATPKPRLADFPCELLLKELERRKAVISCDCSAIFLQDKPNVMVHASIHSMDKTYSCLECGYLYGNDLQLQIHCCLKRTYTIYPCVRGPTSPYSQICPLPELYIYFVELARIMTVSHVSKLKPAEKCQ